MNFIPHHDKFELEQISHLENAYANAISKLAKNQNSKLLKVVLV